MYLIFRKLYLGIAGQTRNDRLLLIFVSGAVLKERKLRKSHKFTQIFNKSVNFILLIINKIRFAFICDFCVIRVLKNF
jgi:hypothetical protein